MKPFSAFRIHESGAKLETLTLEQLTAGEVVVEVHYSGVNYKDALAGTGKGKILKTFPLNGGIDAAGVVVESQDPRFHAGQKVLVNGCGIGESFDGGFSETLRVHAGSVVPLPDGLSLREAMIIGTAGFTAALALERMEQNGQNPAMGPIVVTGASGGVGSFAVQLFTLAGYEVVAVSGKSESQSYLKNLGASRLIAPDQLGLGARPLEKVLYGGAVDNVGGELLSRLLAHVQLWGNIASIGMAQSGELQTTVMPFILRGVSLLGASSNNCPMKLRQKIWHKLGGELRPKHLETIVARTIGLKDLMSAFEDLIERRVQGRILVEIRK